MNSSTGSSGVAGHGNSADSPASAGPIDRNLIIVPGVDRTFHRAKVMAVLLFPLSMALIAVSSTNVALPAMAKSIGANDSQLQWVVAGYALTFGISLVPAGRAGDVLGRGAIFTGGLVLFTGAWLWCGLAPTPNSLIAARLLQGVGAGLINPQSLGMIQQYFSGAGRARAFALFGMVISASVAIGPVITGIFISLLGDNWGWRTAYLINVPIGLIGLIFAVSWLPYGRERELLAMRRARKSQAGQRTRGEDITPGANGIGIVGPREKIDLDPIGTFILTLSVTCFMWPFMTHSSPWRWVATPASFALLGAWLAWEFYYQRHGGRPVINLELFKIPSYAWGSLTSGAYFLGATSIFVVAAVVLQRGLGVSALAAGFIGLPNAILSLFAARWAGRVVIERGHRTVIEALILTGVGMGGSGVVLAAYHLWGVSYWWMLATLGIAGFGQGAFGAANSTLALADVPVADGGAAGGVKTTGERLGTAVGTAVVTGVLFALVPMVGWIWAGVAACALVAAFIAVAGLFAWRDLVLTRP